MFLLSGNKMFVNTECLEKIPACIRPNATSTVATLYFSPSLSRCERLCGVLRISEPLLIIAIGYPFTFADHARAALHPSRVRAVGRPIALCALLRQGLRSARKKKKHVVRIGLRNCMPRATAKKRESENVEKVFTRTRTMCDTIKYTRSQLRQTRKYFHKTLATLLMACCSSSSPFGCATLLPFSVHALVSWHRAANANEHRNSHSVNIKQSKRKHHTERYSFVFRVEDNTRDFQSVIYKLLFRGRYN